MTIPVAWLNGAEIPFAEMSLPVWDLGVVAGASITEMARTYGHRPFQIADHVQRLSESCEELGFLLNYSTDELCRVATRLATRNCHGMASDEDLGIVFFVTAGANRTYLGDGPMPDPHVGVHTFRLPFELWRTAARDGVRLSIPARKQISGDSLPVHRKVRNRLHWWLADREADLLEAGSRALLVDAAGYLTETSSAAFYGVIEGAIVTARHNVLDSMSRRLVQAAAESSGITFRLTDISPSDIAHMTHAFLSSTPVGLLPVTSISGRRFEGGSESPVPELLSWWERTVGVNPLQQIMNCRVD